VAPPTDAPRVLHVHKFDHVVGGAETYLHSLIRAQRASGKVVETFSVDDLDNSRFTPAPSGVREAVAAASSLLWSSRAASAFDRNLGLFQPDVIHFHSIYHHLSPSVLGVARRRRIPAVMSLHDYKTVAPCYVLHRDGGVCQECVTRRVPVPALRHRCIRQSLGASALCVVEHVAHAPLYRAGVDRFLVPSAYACEVFVTSGKIPANRIVVASLGVEIPQQQASPGRSRSVLYVGRLGAEKGIENLLAAWDRAELPADWRLEVIGDGPLRDQLEARGVRGVTFRGYIDAHEVRAALLRGAALAIPSLSPETFGLSAAEAMATGLPVVAASVGNLPELIGDAGYILRPADDEQWVVALEALATAPEERVRLGEIGRRRIAESFTTAKAEKRVDDVYATVLGSRSLATVGVGHAVT
jgi:glycosyltransferase involved in cell wall biosynthesis